MLVSQKSHASFPHNALLQAPPYLCADSRGWPLSALFLLIPFDCPSGPLLPCLVVGQHLPPVIPTLKLPSAGWPACWQRWFCPTGSGGSSLSPTVLKEGPVVIKTKSLLTVSAHPLLLKEHLHQQGPGDK